MLDAQRCCWEHIQTLQPSQLVGDAGMQQLSAPGCASPRIISNPACMYAGCFSSVGESFPGLCVDICTCLAPLYWVLKASSTCVIQAELPLDIPLIRIQSLSQQPNTSKTWCMATAIQLQGVGIHSHIHQRDLRTHMRAPAIYQTDSLHVVLQGHSFNGSCTSA